MEPMADAELERLVAAVEEAHAALAAHGAAPVDGRDAYRVVRRLEGIARRHRALQLDVVAHVDRHGLHLEDGHRSAKALASFAADLSPAEAARRATAARALRSLPEVAERFRAGRIGSCSLDRIAAVHANPRVREAFEAVDEHVAVVAEHLRYRELSTYLANWERLQDEDGAAAKAERCHADRRFRPRRNLDGSVAFEGGCGSVQGTSVIDVHDAYVRAELEADWAEARARLGDAATVADLVRTDAQRSMDALEAMCRDAARGLEERTGHRVTTHLVLDQVTFERHLVRLAGGDPGPDPRLATWWSDLADRWRHAGGFDEAAAGTPAGATATGALVGFRCSTLDGRPLDPMEATVAALVAGVRRVVARADGVVLDMGRTQRCFTGLRHLAVLLSATHCPWPGCTVATHHAQADHLLPWDAGGCTDPGNGAPTCGKHNRFRNHGFTVHRDERTGELFVTRPDGTRLGEPS